MGQSSPPGEWDGVKTWGRARARLRRARGGAHLSEGRPVILSSLSQAVSVFTVCLEEASCAQLIERSQRYTRGIPEPHSAILVAAERVMSGSNQDPAYLFTPLIQ